ncbi:hypothetical protein BT93_A0238 [Corymbia citriodora subsp. variegata]|nr:hypothetical protein BT93_A0238 [Corymbia citriodora subsp. variegata]
MTHAELVFVPSPGMGHLVSMIEMAKLLINRDPRLSITVLVMKLPFDSDVDSYTNSLATSMAAARIRFVHLPREDTEVEISSGNFIEHVIESNKPHVKRIVAELARSSASLTRRLMGFVLDMFCTTMIDLADELGVPSYVFFTLSTAFLGLMLHLQLLQDEHRVDITEFKDSASELDFPSFTNPLPAKVLPTLVLVKDAVRMFLEHARRMRATKGIVGGDDVMEWLDEQPPSSVVFLCFGSRGSFGEDQVKEIACALERSGHRFLWSLRLPPQDGENCYLRDYEDSTEAIGAFVSHCGWNSTLGSIWFGVAMAAWPLYAEQQFNAFELVVELGLAAEIKMDYRRDLGMESAVVTADEIEAGIRKLMEEAGGEMRRKVKEASEKSRKALVEGGSSCMCLGRLIEDILNNTA